MAQRFNSLGYLLSSMHIRLLSAPAPLTEETWTSWSSFANCEGCRKHEMKQCLSSSLMFFALNKCCSLVPVASGLLLRVGDKDLLAFIDLRSSLFMVSQILTLGFCFCFTIVSGFPQITVYWHKHLPISLAHLQSFQKLFRERSFVLFKP